jgi:hypothetical protein
MIRITRHKNGQWIALDAYLNSDVSRGQKLFLWVCVGATATSIFTMILRWV